MPAKSPLPVVGAKFGEWEYLSETRTGVWFCRCSCGVSKNAMAQHLKTGKSTQCGHSKSDTAKRTSTKHGLTTEARKNYAVWKNAKQRCYNPTNKKYSTYGERGITMYECWVKDFAAFNAYIGTAPSAAHTLGRIDNDIGYFPGNIEWQTHKEQSLNKTNSRLITLRGQTKTLHEWAATSGIPRDSIHARLTRLGWTVEDALTIPVKKYL